MSRDAVEFPKPCMLRGVPTQIPNRPQCIAHRGYLALWPENTMQAFKAAVEAGAQAIETDVHLTKDNHVVLSHDSSLKRCYGVDRLISDCTLTELQELLQYMNHLEHQNVWLLLDFKIDDDPESLIALVSKVIEESCTLPIVEWDRRILLGCWTEEHMILCAKYLPKFPVTYIAYSTTYTSPVFRHLNVSCVAVQMNMSFWPTGQMFMRKMRASDRAIMAWMTNSETSMKWCIANRLEGVLTNDPRRFIELCRVSDAEMPVNVGLVQWLIGLGIYILGTVYGLLVFERRTRRTH